MDAKQDTVDSSDGLEVLDKTGFEKLTELPPNTPIEDVKTYSFDNKKIEVINGKYFRPHDKDKGDITLEKIDEKNKDPGPCSNKKVQLPKMYKTLIETLIDLYSSDGKTAVYPDICHENLAALLSFFTMYSEFGLAYEKYILDPDEGIELVDEIKVLGPTMPGKFVLEDVKATAHLLVLLMAKRFDNENMTKEEQIKKYLEKRILTMEYIFEETEMRFLINTMYLDRMASIWNTYPKLKSTVFIFALSKILSALELHSATMIIAEYSMVDLACISKFLRLDPESFAHTDPRVCQEFRTFLGECKKLKDKFGILWPYYRVLTANDETLTAAFFPNLTKAATAYAKKFFGEDPFFQHVVDVEPTSPSDRELINSAKIELTCKLLQKREKEDLVLITPEERELAIKYATDINKWSPPNSMELPTSWLGLEYV